MQNRTQHRRSEWNTRMKKCAVFVVVLTFLQSRTRGDAEVSCVFMESCILPCSFKPGEGLVLHWLQVTTRILPVHSFYHNQDQLDHQSNSFRGRTSLFKDQVSTGNASLQLTVVKVQDEGRYKCYTGTDTGTETSFINLKVDAPVRKVDIQQVENRITCSSEGVFPKPELTWSTSSQSNVTLQNKTTVQTEQQLYSISSSLTVSLTDLDYSCTVSTPRNKRRATWFQPTSINGSDTETTIPCTSSNTPLTGLIWRFNHSHIILNRTGNDSTVSEEWGHQVEGVSESGSLTLKDLSSDQEGMYTCELSTAEETHVTNTFLRIERSPDSPNNDAAIAGGVIGAILVLIAASFGIYNIITRRIREEVNASTDHQSNSETSQEQEMIPLTARTEDGGQSTAEPLLEEEQIDPETNEETNTSTED